MLKSNFSIGVIATIIAALFLVSLQLVSRYVIAELNYNVWAFVCIQGIAGGIAMIAFAGWKGMSADTFKHPISWIMGLFLFFDSLFFNFALVHISATQANMLVGYAKVFSLLAAWIFFKRQIGWSRIPGILLLLIGLILTTLTLNGGFFSAGFIYILLVSLCLTGEVTLSEKHPSIMNGKTIKERCGYTGVILLVNSLIFMSFIFAISALKPFIYQNTQDITFFNVITSNLPNIQDVLRIDIFVYSALIGLVLRAPKNFFRYMAMAKIKPENYLMLASIQPFILIALESFFIKIGVFSTSAFDSNILVYIVILTAGSLLCLRKV